MPKKSKKFRVKVGKGGNVILTERAATKGKKRVSKIIVKNKEIRDPTGETAGPHTSGGAGPLGGGETLIRRR